MSLRGSMLASVAGQKPRCPQFVGIAKFLRLPARQRHQPCLGLGSDRRLSTGASAIIQRSQRAFGHDALDAALDRLMMQPECPADRKNEGLLDKPAISAPAPPGSPVQCATALSISTSPYQLLQATTQSPAATLPWRSLLCRHAHASLTARQSSPTGTDLQCSTSSAGTG